MSMTETFRLFPKGMSEFVGGKWERRMANQSSFLGRQQEIHYIKCGATVECKSNRRVEEGYCSWRGGWGG